MLGQGLETGSAHPGRGLLQLNPHMGLSVLVHKLHQLLSIITPDQHHWPSQPQWLLQLQKKNAHKGCCILTSLPPVTLSSSGQPLLQHPKVLGYLLCSSSILGDVKEDSAGSSLTRHPGLHRHMAEV